MTQPIGARLPPDGGEGSEICYECEGEARCLLCEGARELGGRRCSGCGGSGACVVCGGRGELPGGTRAYLVGKGWLRL